MIPCSSPKAQYQAHRQAIDAAVARVFEAGWYINGQEVQQFEREFASYVGGAHAIGVGSGTEALRLALAACGVGSGDEVITVSHTAVATVAAVELAGATPVLVDIEPAFYTIDPERVAAAITPKTRAIIVVHLYGQPAALASVMDVARAAKTGRDIHVIEDCAQSHGARIGERRVGSITDVSCFSFYPTKNLGAIGDGGMVVTQDAAVAERARMLREYGWRERYVSAVAGWNTRLDEVQAAILRQKLPHLDADNRRRREIAEQYDRALGGRRDLTIPVRRPGTDHVFHLYVVRHPRRDALIAHLKAHGVGALIHYPVAIHRQPAYEGRMRIGPGGMAATEGAAAEVVSLPMYPELTDREVAIVIDAVLAFVPQATSVSVPA